jgi:hypothetical protein
MTTVPPAEIQAIHNEQDGRRHKELLDHAFEVVYD